MLIEDSLNELVRPGSIVLVNGIIVIERLTRRTEVVPGEC